MTAVEQINSLGLVLSIQAWPSPEELRGAYDLLCSEGLDRFIWYYRDTPSFEEIWRHALDIQTIYYVAYAQAVGSENREIAGLGWHMNVTPYEDGLRAEVGVAFRRKYMRNGISLELATMMLDYGFETCNIVRVDGISPKNNKAILRFIDRILFKRTAVIPGTFHGQPTELVMATMTKGRWNSTEV